MMNTSVQKGYEMAKEDHAMYKEYFGIINVFSLIAQFPCDRTRFSYKFYIHVYVLLIFFCKLGLKLANYLQSRSTKVNYYAELVRTWLSVCPTLH